jgi:hypothetical protein
VKAARWLFVFLFYLAAELISPSAAMPLEALDGEAEESIHLAGQTRHTRVGAARRAPAAAQTKTAALRPSRPTPAPRTAATRGGPVRKVPAPVPESASAPEDH